MILDHCFGVWAEIYLNFSNGPRLKYEKKQWYLYGLYRLHRARIYYFGNFEKTKLVIINNHNNFFNYY